MNGTNDRKFSGGQDTELIAATIALESFVIHGFRGWQIGFFAMFDPPKQTWL